MYLQDPHDKALLPELESASLEDLLEEPRDYHEFFWDDTPLDSGRQIGYHHPIHAQVCRFNGRGEHIVMARNCPHFEMEDQEGKTIQKGWTAQSKG